MGCWPCFCFPCALAAEMGSSVLVFSLHLRCRLPLVGNSLSHVVGIPAMIAAGILLAMATASVAYTVYRFDRMHRTAMELELMAEASYAEAESGQVQTSKSSSTSVSSFQSQFRQRERRQQEAIFRCRSEMHLLCRC